MARQYCSVSILNRDEYARFLPVMSLNKGKNRLTKMSEITIAIKVVNTDSDMYRLMSWKKVAPITLRIPTSPERRID
jgi:hypothetical protein